MLPKGKLMKIKCVVLFVTFCLLASVAFAGDGHVTLKKPGSQERKFIVNDIKFVCDNQEMEAFLIDLDGATAEIPFSALKQIKLIRFERPKSSYRLYFKDSSKDKALVLVKPACNNVKFVGTNTFGGAVTVDTEFMQMVEFK